MNAYYVGELGRWTIDFNADYLNNRVNSNQYAEDGSKDDIHSSSDSRSKLYAAKLQVGVSLGKGQLSFGSEGTLTEREALLRKVASRRMRKFYPAENVCGFCWVFHQFWEVESQCRIAI